jgi:hypothetical protein
MIGETGPLLPQEVFPGRVIQEVTMIKSIAVAFGLTGATSAQAMSPAPLRRCATTSARRHVRRGVVTGN